MNMEAQGLATEKKRRPGWVRAIAWLAFAGGLVLVAVITAFIVFYLAYPVAQPPLALADSRTMALPSPSHAGTSASLSALPVSHTAPAPRAARDSDLWTSGPAVRQEKEAAHELVNEAGQPNALLKAKAREVNESYSKLGAEFEAYVRERGKRRDPDEMTMEEGKAFLAVRDRVWAIRNNLKIYFGRDATQRFDQAYLGRLVDGKLWEDAAAYCADARKNWRETLYCCRQMNRLEGGLIFTAMTVKKFFTGSAAPYLD
jgi:hypothetical protein